MIPCLVVFFILVTPLTAISQVILDYLPQPCTVKWKRVGNKCYRAFYDKIQWSELEKFCKTNGGEVAVIDNAWVNTYFKDIDMMGYNYHNKKHWQGFRLEPRAFTYLGDPNNALFKPSRVQWSRGEPNNKDGYEKCVYLSTEIGNMAFYDGDCEDKYYVICGWIRGIKSFLHIINSKRMTWQEARNACRHLGGDLVDITDSSIFNDLESFGIVNGTNYWTGVKETSQYSNTSGKRVDVRYTNWAMNEPAQTLNGKQHTYPCITMDATGKWGYDKCNEKYHPICQQERKPRCECTSSNPDKTCQFLFPELFMSYDEARLFCMEHFQDLLSATSINDIFDLPDIMIDWHYFWLQSGGHVASNKCLKTRTVHHTTKRDLVYTSCSNGHAPMCTSKCYVN